MQRLEPLLLPGRLAELRLGLGRLVVLRGYGRAHILAEQDLALVVWVAENSIVVFFGLARRTARKSRKYHYFTPACRSWLSALA